MSTAFSGIVKLLSELTEQTTAADTDVMPIGATSPRKITIANLKEALGINALNRKFEAKNVTTMRFGYDNGSYYTDYVFAEDNIIRLHFNSTGIAATHWDGAEWKQMWVK